ncbi:MAG: tRNA uridine-5-carboxymethylaminomethyl(34) synthesis GTPase MnmE [Verrucomicrobia bacterium]|nr:tRNA uridine-5-carboxymethylaminomethyl(34) synthesis GTPase MnmE [Verrucomicrobiota bacterium]
MRDYRQDTIAAIATAPGEAGIAVIRISGPEAYAIADRIYAGKGPRPSDRNPNTIAYCRIRHPDGSTVDDVLMLFMRAPKTFTGEDVVELQGHGGQVQSSRVLRCALDAGARLADPGEFSRRAFLNGRLDLTQAEALLDLIRAKSDQAAVAAIEQLEGKLSNRLSFVYKQLIEISADLESTLDFPDDELPEAVSAELLKRLAEARAEIGALLATWQEGRLLREGASVVIAGKPNVGKSTLLNAFLGTDRAIVADVPGTTRDSLEESWVLDGIPLRLVDTAGLRETDCLVEQEGIRRSRIHLDRADVYLYLFEARQGMDEEDLAHLQGVDPHRCILVANKVDLGHVPCPTHPFSPPIPAALHQGQGLAEIRTAILKLVRGGLRSSSDGHAVISARHRRWLIEADRETAEAEKMILKGVEAHAVLASEHLKTALEALGSITGKVYHQELLDTIFSRFCIGK